MKAKEYTNKLFEFCEGHEDPESVTINASRILILFLKEGQELAESRNARSDEADIAILKEQSDKWRAFANNVNKHFKLPIIKPTGYKDFVISEYPELKGRF